MALAGMSVTIGTAISPQGNGALPFNAPWSQNIANPGGFTAIIPPGTGNPALVRCWAAADSYVAFSTVSAADAYAKAQDANVGPRWPVPGAITAAAAATASNVNAFYDYYAAPGSYVGWTTA